MIRRTDLLIYGLAIVLSLVAHLGLIEGLAGAAARHAREHHHVVEFSVFKPPPPPVQTPKPKPKPKPKPVDLTKVHKPPPPEPPPPNTSNGKESPEKAKPVFGISMSSTVGPGVQSSFHVRVGNTLMKDPEKKLTPADQVKAYAPVPLSDVTKMPQAPTGGCPKEPYPPAARALGIQGQVTMQIVVGTDGKVGAVQVLKGLGHGLNAAAVRGIKKCKFEPAELNGHPVATQIIYTYTFLTHD